MSDKLEETRLFWNNSPCDGHELPVDRKSFRYSKEPWIPKIIERIARSHAHVVEVGCGQGTDGLLFSSLLPEHGSYIGLDYSEESVLVAKHSLTEAPEKLTVQPEFRKGNAEELPFEDDSVECVYSMGVLHHSPDTQKTIQEIRRVLTPGGKAYIFIYRVWAPKIIISKILRGAQLVIDRIFGGEKMIYKFLNGRHQEKTLGTMLLECFGVPVLRCYRRSEIPELFHGLKVTSLNPYGYNLPWFHQNGSGRTPFGILWLIEAEKSPTVAPELKT